MVFEKQEERILKITNKMDYCYHSPFLVIDIIFFFLSTIISMNYVACLLKYHILKIVHNVCEGVMRCVAKMCVKYVKCYLRCTHYRKSDIRSQTIEYCSAITKCCHRMLFHEHRNQCFAPREAQTPDLEVNSLTL